MIMGIDIKHIKKTISLQYDEADCGPACLLSMIKYYGGGSSMAQLRELCGTSKTGTTLLGLYEGAAKIGLIAEGCEADVNSLKDYGKPVILHCLINNSTEHYICCYGFSDSRFVVFDPSSGVKKITEGELDSIWKSHYCLTLQPSSSFLKKKTLDSRKRKWLWNAISDDREILVASVVLGLVVSLLSMATAIFSQKLVDEIIPNNEYVKLWAGIGLLFLLLVARCGLSSVRCYLLNMQSRDFCNRIIDTFFSHLLFLPRSFFDTRRIGDLVARLNDTHRIQTVITSVVGDFIINGLIAFVTLAMLFNYSALLGTILSCCIPVVILAVCKYNSRIVEAQRKVMVGYSNSESNFINTMQGIETVRNMNLQRGFAAKNKAVYGHYQKCIFDLGKLDVKMSFAIGLVSVALLAIVISVGCQQVLCSSLKLGELMAVISLSTSIVPSVAAIALVTVPVNEAKVAFNRMFEFMNVSSERFSGKILGCDIDSVDLRGVSYHYPGRPDILRCVDACFRKGELHFVIGDSGSGKSTLCHIIDGSYIPTSGSVNVNRGINLMELSLSEWRSRIGVMPQDVFMFNGTVLDNILLGVGNKSSVENTISKIVSLGIDKFLNALPQGLMTIVGEDGINLSGGQKQMIGLVRVLLREPSVIVLDEPTSAMDGSMEAFFMNMLREISREKIVIVVSHKLHVLRRYADVITLLDNDNAIVTGTHDELMKTDNIYSAFWKRFDGL